MFHSSPIFNSSIISIKAYDRPVCVRNSYYRIQTAKANNIKFVL